MQTGVYYNLYTRLPGLVLVSEWTWPYSVCVIRKLVANTRICHLPRAHWLTTANKNLWYRRNSVLC